MARPTTYKHSGTYYVESYLEYREYFNKEIGTKKEKGLRLRKNQRRLTYEEYIERVDELKNSGLKVSFAKAIYRSQGAFSYKQAKAIAEAANKVLQTMQLKALAAKALAIALKKKGVSEEEINAQIFSEEEQVLAPYYKKTARAIDIETKTPFGTAILKYIEEKYRNNWRAFFY